MSAERAGRTMPWHGSVGSWRLLTQRAPRRVIALAPQRHATTLSGTLMAEPSRDAWRRLAHRDTSPRRRLVHRLSATVASMGVPPERPG